ncbi:MAG: hypothetical protein U0V87_10665 [Acidobacteriota bacterium]
MNRPILLGVVSIGMLCVASAQSPQEDNALTAHAAVKSVLDGPFPGRARGMQLTAQGQHLLDDGQIAEALATLRRAVRADPILDAAWSTLAAVAIADCRRDEAIFAAYQAAYLNSESSIPVQQLRAANALQCPAREESDPGELAEARVAHEIHNVELWRAAAEARSGADEPLLSAYYLERALASGAEAKTIRPALIDRLDRAGLWRAALRLLEEQEGDAVRRARLSEKLEAIAPQALRMARELSPRLGIDDEDSRARLGECVEVVMATAPEAGAEAWRDELLALFGTSISTRTAFAGGSIELESAWSRWSTEAEQDEDESRALLMLRRHPGDTQLSLYGVAEWRSEAALDEAIGRALTYREARRSSPWNRCRAASEYACRTAAWSISTASGVANVELFVLDRGEGKPAIVAIAFVGSGGYGAAGRQDARAAVEALITTIRIESDGELLAASADDRWNVPIPPAWRASDRPREAAEPWLSFPLGSGLRMDLPAGAMATREAPSFDATAVTPPDALLFWRASFVDRDGHSVRVGDRNFWAWARGLPTQPTITWTAPPSDPNAVFERASSLDAAFIAAGSEWRGSVARFRGSAWHGRWLIARVLNGSESVEIAQPIAESDDSLSLLWIAVTVRRNGEPGPPPLVEQAGGQAIRIQQFAHLRSATDPREGLLSATDFEFALPRGFRVSATPSSNDGLPLTLRHVDGSQILVEHWNDESMPALEWRELAARLAGRQISKWREWTRGRTRLGLADVVAPTGAEALLLARSTEGAERGLRVRFVRGAKTSGDAWSSIVQLVGDTLKFTRR